MLKLVASDLPKHKALIPSGLYKPLEKLIKKDYDEDAVVVLHIEPDQIDVFDRTTLSLTFRGEEELPEGAYYLPFLFAVDKKGKERIWKIWVVSDTVYKSYGEVSGARIPSERVYKGVNLGKVNETTAEEQAIREAEREWVKQLDKGYLPKKGHGDDISQRIFDAKKKQGNVNANISALIRGITPPETEKKTTKKSTPKKEDATSNSTIANYETDFRPMHCQTWTNEPKVLKYFDFENGVYIQPKLDGIRCLVKIEKDQVVLLSRKGKQFVWLDHLREEALIFLKAYPGLILDCEVYAEKIYGKLEPGNKKVYSYTEGDPELLIDYRFEVISGATRPVRKEPHPLEDQLSLYVFDIADPTGELDQDERFEILKGLFARPEMKRVCPHIKRVETKDISYYEEVEDYHDEVAAKGYEGVVLRARDLMYESDGRSLRMRKYKHFVEEECVIVDISHDQGVNRDQFCWVCEKEIENEDGTKETKTFKAKPEGTTEQKREWYDNSEEYIGKLLTVKYQKLDAEIEGIPRFPIGKAIRDYE